MGCESCSFLWSGTEHFLLNANGYLLISVLVASAIRLRLLLLLDLQGFFANWAVENSVLWSAIENCMGVVCICLPSLRPVVNLLPGASRLGKSVGSGHTSGRDTRYLEPEHDAEKAKQQQYDEYELLERDRDCCWVEAGRLDEGHSIKTIEEDIITVQTQIQVSSGAASKLAEAA